MELDTIISMRKSTGSKLVPVVYVDRALPDIILNDHVSYIKLAKWVKLSKQGMVIDSIEFNSSGSRTRAYRVMI